MDTLRALLVAWIIGGHALLGYSAIGGWAYDEVNEVTFTPPVELVLAAVLGPSALFFMGTFFLVAGLFTPRSLARKGTGRFAADRAIRLGIPFLVSALVIWPLAMWSAYRASGQTVSYGWLLTGRNRLLDSGALWFAEVLLIFSLAYAVVCLIRRTTVGRPASQPRALTGRRLIVLAAVLAMLTFVVRLWLPARATQPGDLHLWQWPQLATMFGLGVAVAGTGLAREVPERLRRLCGVVLLITVFSLPLIALLVGVDNLAADAEPFLGGWAWQAMLMPAFEALLVVFGSIWLLGFAQRTFSATGQWITVAIRGSFAAFVLQGPVLIALALAVRPLPAPAEVKAPVVAALGILACFWFGWVLVTRTRLGKLL